jgi:hypothetical protein
MAYPDIVRRQQHLLQRSAALRQRLALDAGALRAPMNLLDLAYTTGRWVCRHPAWAVGALAFWMVHKPLWVGTIGRGAWSLCEVAVRWRLWGIALPKLGA